MEEDKINETIEKIKNGELKRCPAICLGSKGIDHSFCIVCPFSYTQFKSCDKLVEALTDRPVGARIPAMTIPFIFLSKGFIDQLPGLGITFVVGP